jgi:ElaB/YqjD/DUF883 family membrane-anchored ribosome-binding protein
MGQDPSEIRQEIEQTRQEMGNTVEALGHKADVPGRAKEKVQGMQTATKDKVQSVTSKISGSTPDSGEVKDGAQRAVGVAQENPLGLAIGAAAAGFLAGLLIPSTKVEDDKIGQVADQVKDKVKETGQEAVEHGKQVAQEVAQNARETVQESGQEHAQEMKDSAQQKAQETRQEVGSQS